MLRKFILMLGAVASLGLGGVIASSAPAAAQGFYFGYGEPAPRYHRGPPRDHYRGPPRGYGRHWGPPPPRHWRHHRPRDCERVRVRYFDGYGWRVRTERRCYR